MINNVIVVKKDENPHVRPQDLTNIFAKGKKGEIDISVLGEYENTGKPEDIIKTEKSILKILQNKVNKEQNKHISGSFILLLLKYLSKVITILSYTGYFYKLDKTKIPVYLTNAYTIGNINDCFSTLKTLSDECSAILEKLSNIVNIKTEDLEKKIIPEILSNALNIRVAQPNIKINTIIIKKVMDFFNILESLGSSYGTKAEIKRIIDVFADLYMTSYGIKNSANQKETLEYFSNIAKNYINEIKYGNIETVIKKAESLTKDEEETFYGFSFFTYLDYQVKYGNLPQETKNRILKILKNTEYSNYSM